MLISLLSLKQKNKSVRPFSFKLNVLSLLGLIVLSPIILAAEAEQPVEGLGDALWFKADFGVNSAGSIPADKTRLTTWFDQSRKEIEGAKKIDGGKSSHHTGEEPVQQALALPTMPLFRYDQTAHMNFNPVIQFDGADEGNAIEFETPTFYNQTVFVVFKSEGVGRGLHYTSGLLYGGDVSYPACNASDVPNPSNPRLACQFPDFDLDLDSEAARTDMSFGIASQSWLAFGGGFKGDAYDLGRLRLLNLPSIGVLTRAIQDISSVDFSMYANGAVNVANKNYQKPGLGLPLTYRARIGRHFSGEGNLTGLFAELIVVEGVITDKARHVIESYLAIKYGVTLNSTAHTLGSLAGNNGYDYLNSAGDVIWQSADKDQFKYNVAGLGRDDARGLDQRISRSVNYGAVLTMSTNADFTNLNLSESRPAFNGSRDYMVWSTDKSSTVVSIEEWPLPPTINIAPISIKSMKEYTPMPLGILSRIDRNWQVQLTNTDGSNIENLSLEFDLNQMVDVDSVEKNSLLLMVDNNIDKDGDYTTGVISYYEVNQWVNNKAQFDNITLANGAIFTIALKITGVQINKPINADTLNQEKYPVSGVCSENSGNVVIKIEGAIPASQTVSCNVNTNSAINGIGQWQAEFNVAAVAAGLNTVVINAAQDSKLAITQTANKLSPAKNTPPQLDLDPSNTANNNFRNTFNEGSSAINIADTDVVISDDQDLNLVSAQIILINKQVDDKLTVGVLPVGMSSEIDENISGKITITLTGEASLADYQQAIRAIGFNNTSQAPSAIRRIIEVVVNDGKIDSAIAKTKISVINTKDLFAADDPLTVVEDSVDNEAKVSENDSTTSGGALSYSLAGTSTVNHGRLVFNGNGSYRYTPNANYHGRDDFKYTVTDLITGESLTQNVTITVTSVVDLTAEHDDITVAENSADNGASVSENDQTTSGAILSYKLAGELTVQHGSLTFNNDGSYHYTPHSGYFGKDSFSYSVTDPITGETSIQNVTITVNENTPPQLDLDPSNTADNHFSNDFNEGDSAITIADIDVAISDAQDLNLVSAQITLTNKQVDDVLTVDVLPVGISSEIDENISGKITITLTGDASLADYQQAILAIDFNNTSQAPNTTPRNIEVVVNDGQENSAIAKTTITVTDTNDLFAEDDQLTVAEDSTRTEGEVHKNDYTSSEGTLSYSLADNSTMAHGKLEFKNDGSYFYTPAANYHGSDSFKYTVTDGVTKESLTKNVTITVTSVVDLTAEFDSLTVDEDSGENSAKVTENDSTTSGGTLVFSLITDVNHGELQLNVDGSYTYTPNKNYAGDDSFSYQVTDSAADETKTITVGITVNDVEDLTAKHHDITFDENSSNNGASVADTTTSGAILSYELAGEFNVQYGRLTFNNDGSYRYTPHPKYFGNDSFSYRVTDPITGEVFIQSVTITVIENNNTPIANNDQATTANNTPVSIAVLDNDTDSDMVNNPGEKLTIIGATAPVGTVTWANDQLTYIPAVGFDGTATIKYQIQDPQGAIAQALVFVDVEIEDKSLLPVITLPDDIVRDANALYTKLDLGTATAIDRFGNRLPVSLVDGITLFEPGVSTTYWQATDRDGNVAIATQSVKVRPLVSIDLDQIVIEGYHVSVGVHLNGASSDYPLEIPFTVSGTASAGEDHDLMTGSIIIESGTEGVIHFNIAKDAIFDDGETIIIELSDSLNRGNKYSHQITISETNVAPDLKLAVIQQNQQRLTVVKGIPVVINSAVSHPISNKEFDYQWAPAQDVLVDTDDNPATFSVDTTDLAVGIYAVTLKVIEQDDSNYHDQEVVYFEVVDRLKVLTLADTDRDGIPDITEGYADHDGDGIADYLDAVAECNVLPEQVNYLDGYFVEGDPGVCLRRGDFSFVGKTGGAQITNDDIAANSEDLLINDPDADNVGGIFDIIAYGLPDLGQNYQIVMPQTKPIPSRAVYRQLISNIGWVTFTETSNDQVLSAPGEQGYCPPPGGDVWQAGLIEGSWCVELILADGGVNDRDNLANSTIVVGAGGVSVMKNSNQQPVAVDDEVTSRRNMSVTIDVLSNDTDPDIVRKNGSLEITSATAKFGEVTIVDGKLVYTPSADFIGSDSIIYGISDLVGGTDFAHVNIVVSANQPPQAQNDVGTIETGVSLVIQVLSNDSDADDDPLVVRVATANNGTVIINDDNSLTYMANSGFVGTDTISYYIDDSFEGKASATVKVTVTAIPLRVENSGSMGGIVLILLAFVAVRRQFFKEV